MSNTCMCQDRSCQRLGRWGQWQPQAQAHHFKFFSVQIWAHEPNNRGPSWAPTHGLFQAPSLRTMFVSFSHHNSYRNLELFLLPANYIYSLVQPPSSPAGYYSSLLIYLPAIHAPPGRRVSSEYITPTPQNDRKDLSFGSQLLWLSESLMSHWHSWCLWTIQHIPTSRSLHLFFPLLSETQTQISGHGLLTHWFQVSVHLTAPYPIFSSAHLTLPDAVCVSAHVSHAVKWCVYAQPFHICLPLLYRQHLHSAHMCFPSI